MTNNEYDKLFKILLIGDSGVGKSSILGKYVDNIFNDNFISTIGVDFKITNKIIKNTKIKLQIWDTAGQERFRTIVSSYYRGAHGIIMVYDITYANTFNNIKHWMSEIHKHCNNNIQILLVGNKSDLYRNRQVNQSDAQNFANFHNIQFIETSAKTSENIENCFSKLIETILDNSKFVENTKQNYNNIMLSNKINNSNDKPNDKCIC
jgi:Ras-related protein Rab-1A